ncbi:MAG: cyclic nucleotide-binding domain-containing protein [Halothece sp. Uz-M2-17]|nr:cyclic nucleotide-binding domain-containing protein [Halothece sp. Uz-M2-17]
MFSFLVLQALAMGFVSACSLPLGALTARFWQPRQRALAFLMAFGAGALLSALAIDLVNPAVEAGYFYPLAFGCILGGLLFLSLNQLLNNYGGFLRKDSITAHYFQARQRRRFKRMLSNMGRIDVFQQLAPREIQQLANSVFSRKYPAGTRVYHSREPSAGLYMIEEGEVELLDPQQNARVVKHLTKNDAFGRMAFFTGAPHATIALTKTDTRLWILPKTAFDQLLKTSPTLVEAVKQLLQSHEIAFYLQQRQGLSPKNVKAWVKRAVQEIETCSAPQEVISVERKDQELEHLLTQVRRVPIFQDLSPEDTRAIAGRVFCKRHPKGHTFFHQGELADRMYIIESGEVALIDRTNPQRQPLNLQKQDAFGSLSFLTGTFHTATAIANTETIVWVLREQDFNELLQTSPLLETAVKTFLQEGEVFHYLQERQNFDLDQAARWTQKVIKIMDSGQFIPSAAEMRDAIEEHRSAPVAIWLGLMLDDIPESLVIGSSLVHSQVSFSLMAGLFLSNYPEALSSSVGMMRQGFSFRRVVSMWSSLTVVTAVGAALGSLFFVSVSPFLFFFVEGLAAGCVLTMVVETMLPEAYLKGGSIIGFSTLMGFLAALFFKTFE